jgi:hypothetical protein
MEHKSIFMFSIGLTASLLIWILMVPIWDLKEWAIKSWMINVWIAFDVLVLILLGVQSFLIHKKSRFVKALSRFAFMLMFFDLCLNMIVFFQGGLIEFASIAGALTSIIALLYAAAIFTFYLMLEKETYSA